MNDRNINATMMRKALQEGDFILVSTSKGNADVLVRLRRLDRIQRHAVLRQAGQVLW